MKNGNKSPIKNGNENLIRKWKRKSNAVVLGHLSFWKLASVQPKSMNYNW